MAKKLNCWEFKNCGRGPGGCKAKRLGICPTATEEILNGVHGGHMAGRTCWVVAGTYCDGGVQGIFAKKYINCKLCNFYQKVLEDEGKDFEITINLMKRLQDDDSE